MLDRHPRRPRPPRAGRRLGEVFREGPGALPDSPRLRRRRAGGRRRAPALGRHPPRRPRPLSRRRLAIVPAGEPRRCPTPGSTASRWSPTTTAGRGSGSAPTAAPPASTRPLRTSTGSCFSEAQRSPPLPNQMVLQIRRDTPRPSAFFHQPRHRPHRASRATTISSRSCKPPTACRPTTSPPGAR